MRPRRLIAALVLLAILFLVPALIVVACEDDEPSAPPAGGSEESAPVLGRGGEDPEAPTDLGFPGFATKNTTRVGGADAVANAAATALATFPSRSRDTRPAAVALVSSGDWRVAISAAQLMAEPLRAPMLFSDGASLPAASADALRQLAPTGAREAAGAQVVRVGGVAQPSGYRDTALEGASPAALAQAIDRLVTAAADSPSDAVVVASSDAPEYAMPAAGWAAKSGDPVLWVTATEVPPETRAAIVAHRRPRIYVLGPPSVIGQRVLSRLESLGPVRRISAPDPVRSAIAFARFSDGEFGWNVVDPGHGLVFASTRRPLDAAAGAPLSAAGTYGPLLVLPDPALLPTPVQDFLLDIQPGYEGDPVRGVYNHGWLMGDEAAISIDVQSRIDALLEIQPIEPAAD